MITKYDFNIDDNLIKKDINRLTNQLWKLIPMRENNENWDTQLETVLLEIYGLKELLQINEPYLILITKLEGLKIKSDIEFMIYRKTVFECISLLRELI